MELKEESQSIPKLIEEDLSGSSNTDPSFLAYQGRLVELMHPYPAACEGIGDRLISTISGKRIYGIVIAEINDSIIVAAPVVFKSSPEGIEGKLLFNLPLARIPKSSIEVIGKPSGSFRLQYLSMLLEIPLKAPNFNMDILTPHRVALIQDVLLQSANVHTSKNDTPTQGGFDQYFSYESKLKH